MAIQTEIPQSIDLERYSPPRKMDGSHALVQSLLDHDVRVIFGYPGGAIMPVYDALYTHRNQLRHVLCRNEQGGGHMAEGYARATGEAGVLFVTSGPGLTNAVTPIYDAHMDNTPLVVISGQVASKSIGTRAFQEAPVLEIVRSITKWSEQVRDPRQVPEMVDEAFRQALSGRPGPVLLDFPKDFQTADINYQRINTLDQIQRPSLTSENREALQELARQINSSERPYILAGQGIHFSRAYASLRGVSERSHIPVATTLLGLSSFPADHPNYVGMPGMHGQLGANNNINRADLLIGIGMRFDDRVVGNKDRFAKQARIAHLDIDPALNKLVPVDLTVQADANLALEYLLSLLEKRDHPDWSTEFKNKDEIQRLAVTNSALAPEGPIKAAEVAYMLSQKTEGKAIIVADVGQHQMLAAQHYHPTKENTFITSGGAGTMGYSLPAGLGAKIGRPDEQVVVFVGDGSIQQTSPELKTIAHEEAAVKVVVLDNGLLGMVGQWQTEFFAGRRSEVDLDNPDFVMLARANGINGEAVYDRERLSDAVDRLLESKKPHLLHVAISPDEKVLPMMAPGAGVDQIMLS